MGIKPEYSGQYASKQDELLIYEGVPTSSIILMLKGKMDVFLSPFEDFSNNYKSNIAKSCRLFTLEQNTFLSINDILKGGRNSFSLKSREDCNLFCFPATSLKEIKSIISTQKDYSTYIVSSLANLINNSYNAYQKLLPICQSLNALTQNLLVYYWAVKDKYYFQYNLDIENLNSYHKVYENAKNANNKFFPLDSDSLLTQFEIENLLDNDSELDISTVEYFSSLLNIPLEQRKGFFNSDNFVCEYHMHKASETLDSLTNKIKNSLSQIYKNIDCLYLSSNNLIFAYGKITVDLKEDKEAALTTLCLLEKSISILTMNVEKLQNEFNYFTEINNSELIEYIEIVKSKAHLTDNSQNLKELSVGIDLPKELKNSLEKILEYCSCSQDTIDSFNRRLSQFKSITDKTSSDAETRDLRSSLTEDYYVIYEEAFKKSQKDDNCPKLISMFLNFGYMDERLLTKDQVIALYRLCDKEYSVTNYSIYNTKKWLENIYQNQKEPSINDFGQDYFDVFRDMKKRKIVTDQDKSAYDKDYNAKLSFEINNMIKINQKVCHGHISSYFPILYKDIITRDLEKAVVTPVRIQQALDKLKATDFSIFFREVWYKNDLKGIEKESIMKEILPDIIIVPTFGSRASMWQEITGRGRNTPARFILPAFTDENIDDLVLKLIGAFRWELCRTMMGVAWNDITEKSLTSEYTDYIQFYKKNHDLTEEAKEKVKIQIQKNRNMMKDIFTSDYDTWINYESKGILRLNKVARSILFRYCPLPKEMRNAFAKQPAFSDLLTQLNLSRVKTAKSLASKYSKIFKEGPIDKDMELNLIFYRDL